MKMLKPQFGIKIVTNLIALALAIIIALPMLWSVAVAFKPESANTTDFNVLINPPYIFENFEYVLTNKQANIAIWTVNSFIVASSVTLIVLVLCSTAAFAFARFKFTGRTFWFWAVLAGLMIPAEAKLIPLYILFRNLGMLNTYLCLILPLVAAPFGVIILFQFIKGLPEELFDAAKIDGCSHFNIYMVIIVPLTKAALASLAIFIFLHSWNDFLWPFISITKPSVMTIPVGIPFFNSQYSSDMARPMAANVLASVPVLVAFFIFQKNIIKGISLTGIKG